MTRRVTRAERLKRITEMRARGLTYAEVAAELAVTKSAVRAILNDPDGSKQRARRERYRRPCPRCGRKMDGSNGTGPNAPKLCSSCSQAEQAAAKVWTREAVVAAIQRWARLHAGRPPRSTDWIRAGVWVDEVGEFRTPAAATVYSWQRAPFRHWSDAVVAAGFARPASGRARTGAAAATRALFADGRTHRFRELPGGSLIAWMLGTGELVRVGLGLYAAGPNMRPACPIPVPSSDSSPAAHAAA